jgi:hypothetical protein
MSESVKMTEVTGNTVFKHLGSAFNSTFLTTSEEHKNNPAFPVLGRKKGIDGMT